MLYFWYKFGIGCVRVLPRFIAQILARIIAFFWFLFDPKKKFVMKNMRYIKKGIKQLEAFFLAEKVYANLAMNIADYFELFVRDFGFLARYIDRGNINDRIKDVLKEGKGLIVVSLHVGNWEVAGHLLGFFGIRTHGIGLLQQNEKIESLYREMRTKGNVVVHPLSGGMLGVYKALKMNEVAAIVSDRDINHEGVPVRLFGECVKFPRGAAVLSYKTGARSFIGCMVREGRRYKIILSDEIRIDTKYGEDYFIREYAQKIADFTEVIASLYPDQWFHFFDYFKEYSC